VSPGAFQASKGRNLFEQPQSRISDRLATTARAGPSLNQQHCSLIVANR